MRKGDKGQQSPFKAGLIAERQQLRKRVQVNLMSLIAAAKVTEEEEEEEEKRQTVTEAKSSQITSLCLQGRLFLCVNSGIPVCAINTLCQTEVIISASADSDVQSITSPAPMFG